MPLLCRHFNVIHLAQRFGNRHTVFTQSLDMKLNGLTDLRFSLLNGCSSGYAAW